MSSESASSPAPAIAISFHWDCRICPESRWALPHYQSVLSDLAAVPDLEVIGHGHPRAWRRLENLFTSAGIEPVARIEEVIERASVYVCDNSSTQYETASAGLLNIALNAPWYRRDIHHGLRFWDTIPGPQVDEPADLLPTIRAVLADPSEAEQLRLRAAGRAYAFADGRAAERAAQAIREVLGEIEPTEAVRETNPKAPTTTRGGPGQKPVPIFPQARLVRLGATEAVLGTIRARWDEMPPEDQLEQVKELAKLNDAQLRELIFDTPESETLLGIPQGLT